MNKTDRIFVAGHRGLVGSATVRELQRDMAAAILRRVDAASKPAATAQ